MIENTEVGKRDEWIVPSWKCQNAMWCNRATGMTLFSGVRNLNSIFLTHSIILQPAKAEIGMRKVTGAM